jgi:para-nitrobenzyl esterase
MNISGMNRRSFLWSTSMIAVSSVTLFDKVMGKAADAVIADTVFGKIRGIENRGIKIFKGIPYGANTTGANRFMPPVDPDSWTDIKDALEFGHSAPQSAPPKPRDPNAPAPAPRLVSTTPKPSGPSIFTALGVPGNKNTGEGEDCLVLNVWTPALNDGKKRPVMVWLHGGGFGSGSGSNMGWDGTNLCLRGDVVVLTINHRLNVMGFADLSAFHPDFAGSGDAGVLDIVHALKWVKNNIKNFGGDPDRVMIFGQSGGGRKCETLLAMPSAKGLFHRAVIESGVALKTVDKDVAQKNGEALLNKLGIKKENVKDIQNIPLGDIMTASFSLGKEFAAISPDNLGFQPSVGNQFLPTHPVYPTAPAVLGDVPIIIGTTRTEWTGMTTDPALWHLDEAGLQTQVKKLLGDDADSILALYRKIYPDETPTWIYFLIASDYNYCAPTMKVADRRSKLKKAPVYVYYFAWETPVQGGLLKSPHNLEWPFAFDNVELCRALTGGGADAMALADKVSDAWIAFARTGNPNTPKLQHWPQYTTANRETMVINNESKVVDDPIREQRLAMFRALKYNDN